MQSKARCWTLMLMAVSTAVVLSSPKEKSGFTSADRAQPDVITNSIGIKLVRIPAGEFMMGAEEDPSATMAAFPYADPALLPRESPRHKVRVTKSFYMGQYEVTLGQFKIFSREADYQIDAERDGKAMTGYGKNGELIESTAFRPWAPGWKVEPDHPVGYVSWNDAVAFCDWLSRKEGKKYRLPTEAEWDTPLAPARVAGTTAGTTRRSSLVLAMRPTRIGQRKFQGNPSTCLTSSARRRASGFRILSYRGMTATLGRPRLVAFDRTALAFTTCMAIPGNGARIGSARTTTVNLRSRIHRVRRRALRESLAGVHSITLPLRCGARAATAVRRSRVTAMTVSALCVNDRRRSTRRKR